MRDPNPGNLDVIERAILARRTEALARVTALAADVDGVDALVVRTAGRQAAFPLDDVIAAAALTRLTLVPFAPPEVAGLMLLEGVVAPVFHLHALLGLGIVSLPEYARVVLVGDRAAPLALAVEAAESIVRIAHADLHSVPDSASRTAALTRGVTDDGLLLLDVDAMLADTALTIDVAQRREHE